MSVRSIKTLFVGASLVGVALTLGCATKARITQFSDFATAGQAYIQAADKLVDEAAAATMDVSSLTLTDKRGDLEETDRYTMLRKSRENDLALVSEMFLIKKHNRLLNTYFQGLKDLAGNDAGTQISASAMNAFGAITTIRPDVAELQFGDKSIGEFVQPAMNYAVRQLTNSALEAELDERGEAIHGEIELQRAAMQAIGSWLIEMKKTQQSVTEDNEINKPYAESGKLPPNWEQKRREFMMKEFKTIETLRKAEEAAEKLRDAFASLSEGTSSLTDLLGVLDDANQVLTLLEPKEKD